MHKRAIPTSLTIGLLLLGGCGKGTPSPQPTPTPVPQQVTISISPNTSFLQVGTSEQFTAQVGGSSNQTVTWSVNGIAGGNSVLGIISSSGLYSAPATPPTQQHVVVSAVPAADNSKVAVSTVTITKTAPPQILANVTQTVSAAQGGVISLTDGSSVTIPAGTLSVDEPVTVLLLSSLPVPPPSGTLVGVGTTLEILFGTPTIPHSARPTAFARSNRAATATSGISVNLVQNSSTTGVVGSQPLADVVDLSGGDHFVGIPGSIDSTGTMANSSLPVAVLPKTQTVFVTQTNLNPVITGAPPARFGGRIWNGSTWLDFPQGFDPTKKTLLLTHGILSSVESSYGCVNQIMAAGGYQQVIGFNYDWTKNVTDGGTKLADFINTNLSSVAQLDIEAHSFGTLVTLSALSQSPVHAQNVVLEGGPIAGTPIASPSMVTALAMIPGSSLIAPSTTFDSVLSSGMVIDAQPGNPLLAQISSGAVATHPETKFIKVVGDTSYPSSEAALLGLPDPFGNQPNDSLIPVSSASAPNLPGPAPLQFHLAHTALECDPNVIQSVAAAITNTAVNFAGPFSGSFGTVSSDVCTWSVSLSGTLNITLTENPNGTLSGQATAPTSIGIVVTSGANCTASPFAVTATGSVAGNDALFGGTFTDGVAFNMAFTGSRSGSTVNGSATVTDTLHVTNSDGSVTPVNVTASIASITLTQQ